LSNRKEKKKEKSVPHQGGGDWGELQKARGGRGGGGGLDSGDKSDSNTGEAVVSTLKLSLNRRKGKEVSKRSSNRRAAGRGAKGKN